MSDTRGTVVTKLTNVCVRERAGVPAVTGRLPVRRETGTDVSE